MLLPRTLALLVLACSSVALVACGGDGDDGPAAGATVRSRNPNANLPALPTLSADPIDYPLVPYTSITGLYTISYPQGWTPSTQLDEESYDFMSDGLLRAQAAVTCRPRDSHPDGSPLTTDEYIEQDLPYVHQFGGTVSTISSIDVGGIEARVVNYNTELQGFAIRQSAVYLLAGDCAWAIRLRVYAPGDAAPYFRLFARMAASFRPL